MNKLYLIEIFDSKIYCKNLKEKEELNNFLIKHGYEYDDFCNIDRMSLNEKVIKSYEASKLSLYDYIHLNKKKKNHKEKKNIDYNKRLFCLAIKKHIHYENGVFYFLEKEDVTWLGGTIELTAEEAMNCYIEVNTIFL